jgi:hypothetical protein
MTRHSRFCVVFLPEEHIIPAAGVNIKAETRFFLFRPPFFGAAAR